MGHIKEPKGVDFIIQSEPLTDSDRNDISKFIARHPGGSVIAQTCGIDGTQLFATQGGEGQHSGTARSQLAGFEIGTLK